MSLCPVPPGAAQNESAASVLVSATMTRLTTGDLSVRSFEAYIRDFTFVWLIPLSSWASARRSPSAQPTFLSACRFLCRTESFHSVSSAELCLAHHFRAFIVVTLAGRLLKILCETLAVVRLMSCAKRQQTYNNKICPASFPMPFHASTMSSFAICRSKPLVSPWKVGYMLAHPSVIRQFSGAIRSLIRPDK